MAAPLRTTNPAGAEVQGNREIGSRQFGWIGQEARRIDARQRTWVEDGTREISRQFTWKD